MAGGEATACGTSEEITLEHTPMWIVAGVCSVIVVISLLFERMFHRHDKVHHPLFAVQGVSPR
jgi:mlo protein